MAAAKTERLDARLTVEQKDTLTAAAALVGGTVAGFVVQAAMEAAQELLARQQLLVLSERDSRAMAEALANPPEPNEALLRAAADYRRAVNAE